MPDASLITAAETAHIDAFANVQNSSWHYRIVTRSVTASIPAEREMPPLVRRR
jgi:hypothetical protein